MKNKLAVLLLAVSALAAPLAARADLIWYEGFNYADGSIITTSTNLWARESGTASPSDLLVSNHVLQVSATGAGSISSRQDDCDRMITGPASNAIVPVYASFTIICSNLPSGAGSYFASFYSTSLGYFGRVQALTNGTLLPGTWRLGISANGSATATGIIGVDLATNTPYQVVAELDPTPTGLLGAAVWINPISSTDNPAFSNDSIGTVKTNGVNAFAFRQASGFNGFMNITNLALGTNFTDVLVGVQPTNATAPVIAYPPVGVTNFVGVPQQLSVVANGQGQTDLTYQWLEGGNPISNPNGNSSIFPISNPQITDSGSYSVVVTTPYGLSVTSGITKVVISAAPVPPTITSGPSSVSTFVGESVTFAVQVTSPGNLTYQWKSNGVNIDGANSSSYSLTDVQTNFSGNYSVGVTNDVVPNGVVSSNAVLTVLPAQQVTVAFLRSLVDPTTFLPTANPNQPYEVEGVITTFTNATSGNTASYWLQDGTGGINIFATFGSTFRPNQGDEVSFTGVLSSFGSGLELDADTNDLPQTMYSDLSSGNPLPTPIIIPFTLTNNPSNLSNINANIAGSLVTLTNVYFGTNAGTVLSTAANQNIAVADINGQAFSLEFFDLDLDTAGQTLPTFAYSVTGVLYGLSPSYSVAVTKWSDIVTTQTIISPIPLAVQSTNGNIVVSWSDASFTLQSSTNATGGYADVAGASSPYTNAIGANSLFFRLRH